MKLMGSGVRQTISFGHIANSLLLNPPLDEQSKIADFLDYKTAEIDSAIEKKQRLIELLKEQKSILINQAVTKGLNPDAPMKESGIEWIGKIPAHWELKKLKTFADFVYRGTTPDYVEFSDYCVVNQATFSKGFWNEADIRYTSEQASKNARGKLEYGDILLASTGGGVLGKSFLFKENSGKNFIADSHVTIIRDSKKRFDSVYIYYNFAENFSFIEKTLGQGATNQTELQRAWLRDTTFPFPPIDEQIKITQHIKAIEDGIFKVIIFSEKEIEKLKEFKQTLIAHAVTGKIKV
jgi:type I restriction enzyme S subunit